MILLVLTLAAGCKASEGEACAKPEDCGSGLTCSPSPRNLCDTPATMATMACQESPRCTEDGRCTAKDGECIVTCAADC